MAWPWEIVERDHVLQNPTSAEKIGLLGDYCRLTPASRVLDIACGKCGPAVLLASTYGCRIVGVERLEPFAEAGRARVAGAGLTELVDVRTGDAAEFPLEPDAWDAVLCLGASFIWGTIAETAMTLAPAVRPGGFLAVGEPYWRRPPDAASPWAAYADLPGTVARFEAAGIALTGLIDASDDDWDRYESLHWRAVEEWLDEEPGHPDAADVRARHESNRDDFVRTQRALLGWAILVGRKPAQPLVDSTT